mmetsp:Transcript_35747/g.83715  ORF Transcript_35747/g.83715 Transcript_35747/m.83715 type:complete len:362 (+) Transcript_35747:73-1158(+)
MQAVGADEEAAAVVTKGSPAQESSMSRFQDTLLFWLPPLTLLAVGVSYWMIFEHRNFLTAAYIITQIVTTIGYGDHTPSTPGGRIFMALYVLAALVVLAYYFNLLVGGCLERREKAICDYLKEIEETRFQQGSEEAPADGKRAPSSSSRPIDQVVIASIPFIVCMLIGMAFFRLYEGYCTCEEKGVPIEGCSMDSMETCVATGGNVMSVSGSFYLSMITLTTVGFGDKHPNTHVGYAFSIVWMFVGVAATAIFTTTLSGYLFDSEQKQQFVMSDFLDAVTDEVFRKIDRNHDGHLSRGEFLSFTLMKYGGISEGLIEEINREFEATDTTGEGRVTYDMIVQRQEAIQRKLTGAAARKTSML